MYKDAPLEEKIKCINLLEEKTKFVDLLDLYGCMLTEKQREITRLYYDEDLTLAEIGENLSISRQGVYDALSRCKRTLEDFEEKLKFKDYRDDIKTKFYSLSMELGSLIIEDLNEYKIKKIRNILNEYIEEI